MMQQEPAPLTVLPVYNLQFLIKYLIYKQSKLLFSDFFPSTRKFLILDKVKIFCKGHLIYDIFSNFRGYLRVDKIHFKLLDF